MTLGELIDILTAMPPGATVALGKPNSYRGDYAELAFAPGEPRPATEVLADARACVGALFDGYKGGIYRMGLGTVVHRARWGEYGGDDDALTPAFFGIKSAAELQAELERCSAEVLSLTTERDAALKRCVDLEVELTALSSPVPGLAETGPYSAADVDLIEQHRGKPCARLRETVEFIGKCADLTMIANSAAVRYLRERDAARDALSTAVERLAEVLAERGGT